MLRYPDHHLFSIDDMEDIKKQFERISAMNKIILTTEKDGVRLQKFEKELQDFPIFIIPIEHCFLFNEGEEFLRLVKDFVDSFKRGVPVS
jgi:tetraacyldisaccharide 4'-kinase